MEERRNEFSITKGFEETAKEIRGNIPSIKIGNDSLEPERLSPRMEKLKENILIYSTTIVIAIVVIFVVLKIVKRLL